MTIGITAPQPMGVLTKDGIPNWKWKRLQGMEAGPETVREAANSHLLVGRSGDTGPGYTPLPGLGGRWELGPAS